MFSERQRTSILCERQERQISDLAIWRVPVAENGEKLMDIERFSSLLLIVEHIPPAGLLKWTRSFIYNVERYLFYVKNR
jgi:hypothetical protein